jgi:signal peptidase I
MDPLSDASNALGLELAVEVARTFGRLRLRVTGTSMMPSIQPGDLLSVGRVGLREASPGEIVLFARGGRLFAHRIVERGGNPHDPYLVTRGDRLLDNDPPVFQSELLGHVKAIERRGRPVVCSRRWLKGPNRVLGRLLRFSDRATALFLRLTALRNMFSLTG